MLALYLFTSIGVAIFSSSYIIIGKSFLDNLGKGSMLAAPHDRLGTAVQTFLESYFGEGRNYLYGLCLVFFVLMVLNAVFDFTNTYVGSWLSQRLRMEAMERMMSKLLSLDQPYFDKQNS